MTFSQRVVVAQPNLLGTEDCYINKPFLISEQSELYVNDSLCLCDFLGSRYYGYPMLRSSQETEKMSEETMYANIKSFRLQYSANNCLFKFATRFIEKPISAQVFLKESVMRSDEIKLIETDLLDKRFYDVEGKRILYVVKVFLNLL